MGFYKEEEVVYCTLPMLTLLMSTGLDKKFDDMSQTSGTPFVSGTKSNSTPIKTAKPKKLQ